MLEKIMFGGHLDHVIRNSKQFVWLGNEGDCQEKKKKNIQWSKFF